MAFNKLLQHKDNLPRVGPLLASHETNQTVVAEQLMLRVLRLVEAIGVEQ